ncbi:MAG: hypothetical protein GYA36_03095 [Veillonellaceae bacterium]|jgi:hypothetical protein|nr:hypothetical protein [Veillonellaceae bacterium]
MTRQPKSLALLLLLCLLLVWPANGDAAESEIPVDVARERIAAEFSRMDSALRQTAEKLGTVGLKGEPARKALRGLCAAFPYAVDCTAIDTRGVMLTVEPHQYRHAEGTNIADQPQVARVLQQKTPVLSSLFRAVEGFAAMDAEHPVFTPDGQLIGSVSLLFKPEILLEKQIKPLVADLPVSIWVMNREGQILYDEDQTQIGLNLFLARLYQPFPQLIQLGRQLVEQPNGEGEYEFPASPSAEPVRKKALWRTAILYDAQWRLVMTHMEQEKSGQKIGGDLPVLSPEGALDSLAQERSLAVMLHRNDRKKILEILKGFYEETPGIYSVQWVDAQGINRLGYPEENSLTDYDFRAGRRLGDAKFLHAVYKRQATQLAEPMFEGVPGRFDLRPVFWNNEYQGMVYIVRIR